ncbi:energy-coupling factor transporter transmembrane component T [Serratia sp. 2723]|uniref:energy-coupling factor transporter transmembrane component T n=1 Tax=unclassified Serratia (in: enterobacteria) TaxID=2647522 RepID=UPI003D1ECC80
MAFIDIRTNMLALLVINTLVLTGKGGVFQLASVAVISGLLLMQRRWRAAVLLALCMGAMSLLSAVASLAGLPSGVMVLLAALMYAWPYVIASFMGYYFICATTPSRLIAGMYRLHAPRMVIIPLAVMLRFFPVLWEEQQAIRGAMRLRGLPGSGGILLHPWRTLEYIFIPLIGVMLRSGEALSATALSRGLGSPSTPSSILRLRFTVADLLLVLLCIGLVVLCFYCGEA